MAWPGWAWTSFIRRKYALCLSMRRGGVEDEARVRHCKSSQSALQRHCFEVGRNIQLARPALSLDFFSCCNFA